MNAGGIDRMRYRVPRGTTDILPEQVPLWRHLENCFREVCELFQYSEIRTPVYEHAALFLRAVGQHTDVGGKEMYTFGAREEDGAGLLALRAAVRPKLAEMCDNCRERYEHNPMRILDCKVENWQRLGIELPDTLDYLCEECRSHWDRLLTILKALKISFTRNPRLVRGLDYYTKTVFEIVHPALGAQSTLVAGGRYDGLLEEVGGDPTPAVGFGCGVERVLLVIAALGVPFELPALRPVFVATLGEAARLPGLELLAALRAAGVPAETDYLGRSL